MCLQCIHGLPVAQATLSPPTDIGSRELRRLVAALTPKLSLGTSLAASRCQVRKNRTVSQDWPADDRDAVQQDRARRLKQHPSSSLSSRRTAKLPERR
jgi:hypothetical protein